MNKGPSQNSFRLLITMGDPSGVGPEIILKSLIHSRKLHQYIVFGDYNTMIKARQLSGFPAEKILFNKSKKNCLTVTGTQLTKPFYLRNRGKPNASFGKSSILWIKEAVSFSRSLLSQKVPHSLVTAPINKQAAHMGGFRFAGHTDYLSHLYKVKETSMIFYSKKLKVILVTIHCSVAKAIKLINKKNVFQKIMHAQAAMKSWGIKKPELLVSGLNPHAGEAGAFGREEELMITPAIKTAKNNGVKAAGPFPPDTIFLKALNKPSSCVVAMYHDQGLIPFKLLAFSNGVNATIGLPIMRTSPDHGTAFDIAWKGNADQSSFREALKLALRSLSGNAII